MITREEVEDYAIELIQSDDEINTMKLGLYSVRIIDKIYESRGTCGECRSRTEEDGCEIYESLKPNGNFFCADFERR